MSYPGGKNGAGVYQRIISMMPPHQVYIEPFLGGAAIARLKRPAPVNIAMDLHAPAVENFRKLLASLDPPSRYRARPADIVTSDVASAAASVICGDEYRPVTIADTTRLADARSTHAKFGERRRYSSSKAMLPAAAPKWTVLKRDGLSFLESSPELTGSADTLIYCDPPYLRSTRSGGRLYEHEMPDVDHRRLLRWAIPAKCKVIISGYWSEMYGSTLRNWRCSSFQAMTRGGMATEYVWCNFPEPMELHDYRYLGEGFRERERIKRKKSRWTARLARMPLLERRCLLAALQDTP